MRQTIIFVFTLFTVLDAISQEPFIDPTGTYKLGKRSHLKDGDRYGYFGEIKVKLLIANKIAITFYISKGAPSYNSGSFIDTLEYSSNIAVYKDEDTVKACTLVLNFSKSNVTIKETANYDLGTCWGANVIADGYTFKKKSRKIPIIHDPIDYDLLP